MAAGRELPPKSPATLALLNEKRQRINEGLRPCRGSYTWNDERRAHDVLRTYVCDIYECLQEAYSDKVNIWEWEKEIADEAISVTTGCWKSYNLGAHYSQLIEPLTKAIVLHIGHPLRSGQLQQTITTSPAYAASGVDIDSPSALLKIAMAVQHPPSSLTPTAKEATSKLAEELKTLLIETRWTAETLAEKIGISPRNVYRHLASETAPSLANVARYEAVFSKQLDRKVKLSTSVKRQNVSKTSSKRQ